MIFVCDFFVISREVCEKKSVICPLCSAAFKMFGLSSFDDQSCFPWGVTMREKPRGTLSKSEKNFNFQSCLTSRAPEGCAGGVKQIERFALLLFMFGSLA